MRDPSFALPAALKQAQQSNGHNPLFFPSAALVRDCLSQCELIPDRITRIQLDLKCLEDFYKIPCSPIGYARIQQFFDDELDALEKAPFEKYDQNSRVDFLLLKHYLQYKMSQLRIDAEKDQKVLTFLGGFFPVRFARMIERRRRVENPDGAQEAGELTRILDHVISAREQIISKKETTQPSIALRATKTLSLMRGLLQEWLAFYKDYDPAFTWWVSEPYHQVDTAFEELHSTIKRVVLGIDSSDVETIIGEPVGRAGILDALEAEMIPYTPEELIGIGRKEYAWCESEMQSAAEQLGFTHWRSALEHVKLQFVPPGQQPTLVRDLTKEATEYAKKYDLVTVPPVCEETIQTYMMNPQAQKMNPFFLGGDSIIVSYPTSSMSHKDKLMSMRGNNIHFSRATVFHEMIPGHHLHMHYLSRVRPYRQMFTTPFCIEGWAFYWEMVLWDKSSWQKTPENRIGMLFWRMHRCARIVFSLKYHLGEMTAQECVDLLVDWVGHERATAEAEVRRSVMGDYGPLYQAGYMLGGLQLYALRKEVVEKHGMEEKVFHDTFLHANQMPVELFRALVLGQPLSKDFKSQWKFYKELE